MKITNTLLTIFTLSISSTAFAGGTHDDMHNSMHGGGHSGAAHWMAPPSEAALENPIVSSADSINKGQQLFQQNCASCHGVNADGKGMAGMMLNPKPADLRAMSGAHPDGDFAWKIREGRGAMPSWKNQLNDDQVWHLVNFIQNLSQQPEGGKVENIGHDHEEGHAHKH